MQVWRAVAFGVICAGGLTVQQVAALAQPAAPCTARLDRYQAIVADDHRTGNVNESVYMQIERELSRAAAACAAGHDREALSLIHASEERHGYHT